MIKIKKKIWICNQFVMFLKFTDLPQIFTSLNDMLTTINTANGHIANQLYKTTAAIRTTLKPYVVINGSPKLSF